MLATLAFLSTPSAAPASEGTAVRIRAFTPVADAYVTTAHPRTNYGRSRVLRVDGAPETTTYIRFELRKIRGEITSVTLLLHPATTGRASYAVRRVRDDDWGEQRVTYVNAPRPSPRYASSKPVRLGIWSAIDVTPFVDGGGSVSFAVTTRAARELSFGSRESTNGPRLVVRSDHSRMDDGLLDAFLRR